MISLSTTIDRLSDRLSRELISRLNLSKKPPIYVVIPNQWCSAQRIKIVMIASGNHTVIYRRLVWESPG